MTKTYFLLLLLLLTSALSAQETTYYVAPDGNNKNEGTLSAPFQGLEYAIRQVSRAKSRNVIIRLKEGHYFQEKTITITPEVLGQHALKIAAHDNGNVVISGSIPIEPKWESHQGEIVKATIGKGRTMDQLLMNGKLLNMARYPNYDASQRIFNGTAEDAISTERIARWANPKGGYVHALHQGEWGGFHYQITGKDKNGALTLEGGWQNNRPSPLHKEYRFVENIFEELDAPGEWFYNSTEGVLYLFPPRDLDLKTAAVEVSAIDDIIQLKGSEENPVENVSIDGLVFTGTNRTFMLTKEPLLRSDWTIYRGGAIFVEGAKNITITNNVFKDLGGNAVFVSKYNRGISIAHNHIYNIGGNAISFVGDPGAVRSPSFQYAEFVNLENMDFTAGPKTNNYPKDCISYDNLIHEIGTIEKQVAGVQISMAMDITASHNTIYDVPRSGINIGDGCWGGHLIEYNDVFNTVQETGDHGAFNSWGRDRFWIPSIEGVDTLVAEHPEMPFLDAIKPITLRNNRFYCAHGWDIDLDDGSSNYRIYNNVALNGGIKLREGYHRVVENNIMVNNSFHPHVWYANSQDVFKHNIVTTSYAPIRIKRWGKEVDRNFFIQKSGLALAQQAGTDQNSLTGDPLFVNEALGDFSVQPSSKALSIGFKNFSMSDFGVVSDFLKAKASHPVITGIRILKPEDKGATGEWNGAIIKNIESLGEQSAAGIPDQDGVLIVRLSPGSLAFKSGLLIGDVIREIGGESIENMQEMHRALQQVMWQGHANAVIIRNQQPKEMILHLK